MNKKIKKNKKNKKIFFDYQFQDSISLDSHKKRESFHRPKSKKEEGHHQRCSSKEPSSSIFCCFVFFVQSRPPLPNTFFLFSL